MSLRATSSCSRASLKSRAASAASGKAGGGGFDGRRRARLDEAVERGKRFAFREGNSRALERKVAEKKPHRPRLGDLLDHVEDACRAIDANDSLAAAWAKMNAAQVWRIQSRQILG